jgi:(S)-2-hydroxyglutarate dehydrogenase
MIEQDFIVIGGGIVGLSTAMALAQQRSGARVLVLEKERALSLHQTGRNSGVIHSGVYYRPGSLKARFATAGNRSMVDFCRDNGVDHDICGKVIVATEPQELSRLDRILETGRRNGLDLRRIGPDELREMEPHVNGLAAIHVPSAGIVNYSEVAAAFAREITQAGGEIRVGSGVRAIDDRPDGVTVETDDATYRSAHLVNCAGLHSDRIAGLAGVDPGCRIVPFRGEYYTVVPEKRHLVRNLVYPVPDPSFPFLGVHLTRMIDGSIHAGPNAVLAFRREGYRKTDFRAYDAWDALTYPGFLRLARRHFREGIHEMYRSLSKGAFVRSLQRLVPDIRSDDVIPSEAGVRAQALKSDGTLVDDFLIVAGRRSVHVCNAPSPAATASIEIGKAVVGRMAELQPAEVA